MTYKIGNRVIHCTHGPGKIIAIDEKRLDGQTRRYYVVETGELTLWVPVDEVGENSIRTPYGRLEFTEFLMILRGPGESLPDRHSERKNQLNERMQKRKLVNICHVIRDLTTWSQLHKLNENDRSVLKRAENCLLDEWEMTLGIERSRATHELEGLLGGASAA